MNNNQTEAISENFSVETSIRPALIISDKTINDYQAYLNNLLVGLADQSVPVALIYDSKWEIESFVPPSIELIQHSLISLPWLGSLSYKRLFEELTAFKPTVLHCMCGNEIKLVKKLSQQMELPFMVSVNSLGRFKVPRYLLKNLFAVTVSAQSIAENIKNSSSILADRVKLVNMAAFAGESTSCFSDLNQQVCMVTAGPIKDDSLFECLLEAIRYLAIDGYEFIFFIMGQGPAERKLRKRISALGISEMVTIVPRLQDWRSVLSAADIFIRPWPDKTFNPLLLEAMSVGTAIAACSGGVDDLIIDGQTAVVFDGSDDISIMNTLKALLNRPEEAHQLAARAQQYISENHKVSDMVETMMQLYQQAANLNLAEM
ncbi:MAG: glycosyltransferase [Planctomycetota bacterium]|jgi:hypothetical protein